jgi:hypothetical protein
MNALDSELIDLRFITVKITERISEIYKATSGKFCVSILTAAFYAQQPKLSDL